MTVAEFARRRARQIVVVAAVLVLLLTVWRETVSVPRWAHVRFKSGVWLAMGDDFQHGEFFRPIISARGYGGSRYFPLQVALLAGLMKLGLAPVAAGFVLTFASAAALIAGVAAFLRRLGTPGWFALAVGALILAPRPVQETIVAAEGDLLPTAFTFWGLAFCASLRAEDRFRCVVPASLFFALAVASKASAVFGAGASFIWLAANGRWRQGLYLAFLTGAISAMLFGAAEWASDGRFLANLRACGSAGGSLRTALPAPWRALHRFLDPCCLPFALPAGIVLGGAGRRCLRDLPTVLLLVTVLGTVMVYATPGTSFNHLLDLCVTLIVVAAAGVALRHVSLALGGVVLAVICAAVAAAYAAGHYSSDRVDRLSIYRQIAKATEGDKRPLLADDAMVPLVAGERPFLIDAFMVGRLLPQRRDITADLHERLAGRGFRAVVVMGVEEGAQSAFAWGDFGALLARDLEKTYNCAKEIGGFRIYLPLASAVAP
jgi:hypothetical protein